MEPQICSRSRYKDHRLTKWVDEPAAGSLSGGDHTIPYSTLVVSLEKDLPSAGGNALVFLGRTARGALRVVCWQAPSLASGRRRPSSASPPAFLERFKMGQLLGHAILV